MEMPAARGAPGWRSSTMKLAGRQGLGLARSLVNLDGRLAHHLNAATGGCLVPSAPRRRQTVFFGVAPEHHPDSTASPKARAGRVSLPVAHPSGVTMELGVLRGFVHLRRRDDEPYSR